MIQKDVIWLDCYDKVAEWLTDNHNKGLFCMGGCGRGKTEITQRVIPILLSAYGTYNENNELCKPCVRTFNAVDMMDRKIFNDILSSRYVCIDDVGTENDSVSYGERRRTFI